jgi:hypothetical protein
VFGSTAGLLTASPGELHFWHSRACEPEQGAYVLRVRGLQRVGIAPPEIAGTDKIGTTPGEDWPFLSLCEHIRHQACMAAIPVGKGVNENQAVMKSNREFIGAIGPVLEPIARVSEQSGKPLLDSGGSTANRKITGTRRKH